MGSLQSATQVALVQDGTAGAATSAKNLHNISSDLVANIAHFAISTPQEYRDFILVCKGTCNGEAGNQVRDKVFRGELLSRTVAKNPVLLDPALGALPQGKEGLGKVYPYVKKHAASITAISFVRCVNVPAKKMAELPCLTKIDLSGSLVTDKDVGSFAKMKLTSLRLADCLQIKNHVLDRLNRDELEVLDLTGCGQLQTHALNTFQHNLPQKLKVIRLSGVDMRGYVIGTIFSKLPQLEELDLFNNSKCRTSDQRGAHLNDLVKIKTLTTLNVGGTCQMVTRREHVQQLGSELPNLKVLVVPKDRVRDVEDLADIFQNLTHLNGEPFKKAPPPKEREERKE